MKDDRFNRIMLGLIALLLLLNFMQGLFTTDTAMAQNENGQPGRYQISAWAAQSVAAYHHTGYYVIDTVTGKITDSKSETHAPHK